MEPSQPPNLRTDSEAIERKRPFATRGTAALRPGPDEAEHPPAITAARFPSDLGSDKLAQTPQERCVMSKANRLGWTVLYGVVGLLAADASCFAQTPNPYRPVKGLADGGGPSIPGGEWAKLPGGREMGPPASVQVDVDG